MNKEKQSYDVQYNTEFWRYEFAGRALHAMVSNPETERFILKNSWEAEDVLSRHVRAAVIYAEALIEELQITRVDGEDEPDA